MISYKLNSVKNVDRKPYRRLYCFEAVQISGPNGPGLDLTYFGLKTLTKTKAKAIATSGYTCKPAGQKMAIVT